MIQLDQIFDTLEASNSPEIVCGDFNVWSERRLKLLNQRTADAGLAEGNETRGFLLLFDNF